MSISRLDIDMHVIGGFDQDRAICAHRQRVAQDARRNAETYRKSMDAQDEASELSDSAVSDWLRNRSKR